MVKSRKKPRARNDKSKDIVHDYGIDISRLRAASESSRRKLEAFRRKRLSRLRQMVGKHYSDEGSDKKVPINLLALFVSIFHRQLAAGRPAALIEVDDPALRPFAADYELRLNQKCEEIGLEYTIKSAVMDAIFSIGIVKVGTAASRQFKYDDGTTGYTTEAFCDCVHLDDWVHDMDARAFYGCQFEGDRYRLNFEYVKDSPLFNNKEHLRPTQGATNNEQGDPRAHSLSGDDDSFTKPLEPYIELWDYWIPGMNKVVTVSAEGGNDPIRVVDWVGPDNGPYHKLGYGMVPDNTMPLAPTAALMDLHNLANALLNKLGNQSVRQKTIGLFNGNDKDPARINATPDGNWANVNNPAGAKEHNFGGPHAPTMAFYLQVKDVFNYMAGNLDALGGLSPQAKTLGQDELLKTSASQQLAEMQDRTTTFTGGIFKALAYYERHNPHTDVDLFKRIPGFDEGVRVRWSPEYRTSMGDPGMYKIGIQPYSMQHTTPQMKLQAMTQVFSNFYAPFAMQMQAQGFMIDFRKLNTQIARLGNLPEISDMLVSVDEQSVQGVQDDAGGSAAGGKSPITKREYSRTSNPGTSRHGSDDVLSRVLSGGGVQPAEMANA